MCMQHICLRGHVGQHNPKAGIEGNGFRQGGGAHSTSPQLMVGRIVGSSSVVGGDLVPVCNVLCK